MRPRPCTDGRCSLFTPADEMPREARRGVEVAADNAGAVAREFLRLPDEFAEGQLLPGPVRTCALTRTTTRPATSIEVDPILRTTEAGGYGGACVSRSL